MSVEDDLEELASRLETVADHLEAEEFEAARETALGLSEIMNCPMCRSLENGVLGGVMFAAGMTPVNKEGRAQMIADEIRRFLDTEWEEARETLRNMPDDELPKAQ